MRQFRLVHIGVAAALGAAVVTSVGLVQSVGATGTGVASVLVPITPCRLIDTRTGADHVGTRATPIGAGEAATFAVWGTNGNCTIPTTATGIASNATAVNPTSASYVTVYPADANPRPTASNLNVVAGAPPTPNQVTVGLSVTGAIGIYNNGGTVDLVVDIVGYYQASTGGSGSTGPQGPQGPAGITGTSGVDGAPGPTCPASGCSLVLTAWNSIPVGSGSTLDNYGCRTFGQFSNTFLPIGLPLGAKITGVSVRYIDTNAATSFYSLFMITVPGTTAVSASVSLGSVDNQTSGSLVFSSPPPPVGPANVPYILASMGSGVSQTFCGATITYTF